METSQAEENKDLDELMKHAKAFAQWSMQTNGYCQPTAFMQGTDGISAFAADQLSSVQAKNDFAETISLMCDAKQAEAVVLVSEAWVNDDPSVLPSQSPDRQEVIITMGETRDGRSDQYFPIVRNDEGQFVELGAAQTMNSESAIGRFSTLLSDEMPDARSALEHRGFRQASISDLERAQEREGG